MLTLNILLKELRNVPLERLEDLYSIIHSLQADTKSSTQKNRRILSFAGAFSDLKEDDFKDFQQEMKDTRNGLFNREVDL